MADSKISALTAVVTPASTDEFAVNQGGTSKKETRAQIHALQSGEHLVLPQVDEAATPTLAFGDGNTGFYERIDNEIDIAINGSRQWFISTQISGADSAASAILNTAASATVPTAIPNRGDADTGIGSAAADQLSLIAGGVEVVRLTEDATNTVGQLLLGQEDVAASPTLAFGDGNTGFYESADNTLMLSTAGAARVQFAAGQVRSQAGSYWSIQNETPSGTNPVYCPGLDLDTGLGSAAADQLSLIAGGEEFVRISDPGDVASGEVFRISGPTRATSADNDEAYVSFLLDVDDGQTEMARIAWKALDVTTATEDAVIEFECMAGGTGPSGTADFNISATAFYATSGARHHNATASDTVPVFTPGANDFDTGIGSAAADQLSLIAGGVEVARLTEDATNTVGQLLLGQEAVPTSPTLAFGDGDAGFYESADDNVVFTAAGSAMCHFQASGVEGDASVSWRLVDTNATVTNPTILPYKADTDTGIGANSTAGDNIVLVVGGTQAFTITEASSINTFDFDAGDNAAPQVGALTSVKSVSATVPAATAATLTASNLIPAGCFMIGLTLRIETTFDNSSGLTTFSIGDGSDADRWGSGIARTSSTTVDLTDATASPGGWFTAANNVVLTADAGTFDVTAGSCDIIIHYVDLTAATG